MIALGMLLTCCACAFSLDPSLELTQLTHKAWTARDGLKGTIRSIAQTPDGYLWLGTEFGLIRFDGVHFVPWTPPPGERLPSPYILVLLAARDGTLWIGTINGLASWNQGKLSHYPDFAEENVSSLLEDHEGTVWVGASGKLCTIRSGKTECSSLGRGLEYDYENGGKTVVSLCEDSDHHLWAGIESGLWQWNPGPPKLYIPLSINSQQSLVQGDRGTGLVFVGDDGVLRQISANKIDKYPLSGVGRPLQTARLLRDRDGALWVGTYDQGLLRVYQGKTSRFTLGEGLSGEMVTALFEDREGSVWVGTANGVDRFREPVVTTLSPYQGLPNPVWSVLPARDGSLWLGSMSDGLTRWNQGQLIIYRPAAASKQFGGPRLPYLTGALFEDQRGRIWATSYDGREGVVWFENGKFTRVSGAPVGHANAIFGDKGEGVWISYPGQGLFHAVGRRVVERVPWPWLKLGRDLRLSAVVPDPVNGGLWLGFLGGGIAYFKDGQITKTIDSKNDLGADQVWSLHFDRDGILWAATEGGLSRIKDGRVSTLTTNSGLPCNAVYWGLEDDASSLWLSTACGLLRIDHSDLQAWASDAKHAVHPLIFDGSDGFRMHTMSTGRSPIVKKSADGKLWFAHSDGVSFIDPHKLHLNKLPPPVHIEQIIADRKTRDISSDANGNVHLPPSVRDLEIDYTALSFVAPEKVLFRYKLEGWDRDWQDAGTRRQAFYSNLPPRNYRFRVAACNNSGVWNEAGAFLDFSIAPAYYQTTWFRSLCVAAFIGLLYAFYQLRLRQVAQQFDMRMEERVSERTRIARDLHDTLLQALHGLMFRFQAARNMFPRRPEEAMQALDGAIMRTEQAIEESRDAIKNLRSDRTTLTDLAELLTATGQELETSVDANGNPPSFRVIVEGERRALCPGIQDEVYRIGCELLRNAFRHARGHHIEAEIRYDDHVLRLLVRDDGKGIDPKVLKEGGSPGHWGLPGIRERAKQIGAQLDFWSEAQAGTEVQLSVPGEVAYKALSVRTGFRRFRREKVS